ncbi:hypothetical protein Tsubulata_027526 [Turnera subulata]|uniref:Nuclease associated modular domain-containing protein n=1 Tax=Turnera subulata TaxID=218843 RepID=A0A9Q0JJI8_9ROSI|nr:hypothetical protein Tsubulata_027526 [Turnera subulata]
MPLLEIATAQASLQNHLGPIRLCKVLSSPFAFYDEKRLLSIGKAFHFPIKVNLRQKSTPQTKAVAPLEPKLAEHEEDWKRSGGNSNIAGADLDASAGVVESPREEWKDLDEKERVRRIKISKANRGLTPWNKGRKHSPETIERIREKTRVALQDPKVKEKLANHGLPHSKATRKKIASGAQMAWKKRREKLMLRESCLFEWQNLIAEASRRGCAGEEELQWDSYGIISEQLRLEWLESVEQRKMNPKPHPNTGVPKPPEQIRKIAQAIAAKWTDPEYRERVAAGLSKYHDIGTAQASLQNRRLCKVLSSPFTFYDEKRLLSTGKTFHFPRKVYFQRKSTLQIKAVATLEPKLVERKEDGKRSGGNPKSGGADLDVSAGVVESRREKWKDLSDRELSRRIKISKANKGITPWNKGRKHSPETIARIREKTRLAMQNPKIKKKLANHGHAQSEETRNKIGIGVRIGWKKRQKKLMLQESCHFEWQNLIAEASRRGCAGEEELQWDSYGIIREQLQLEWLESVEQKKRNPKPHGNRRAPKSPEQRRKIAEAIAAKWADPEYRERVCDGIAKYHGTPVGVEPRKRPNNSTQTRRREGGEERHVDRGTPEDDPIQKMILRRSKEPSFKDPQASSNLRMIKKIRAARAAKEAKKDRTVKKARSLIAKAEKAAKALEVAARRNPNAQASLVETRKLLAEAIQLIESIDTGLDVADKSVERSTVMPPGHVSPNGKEGDIGNGRLERVDFKEASGTSVLASGKDLVGNLTLHEIRNSGQPELLRTTSSRYGFSPITLEHSGSSNQLSQLELNWKAKYEENPQPNGTKLQVVEGEMPPKSVVATKKWVRGRLVDVSGGDTVSL